MSDYCYLRTVRLADTDAAGVIYFARLLEICHEAYEEMLAAAGFPLERVVADFGVVLPIARCQLDCLRPIAWGDRLEVEVRVAQLRDRSFELAYEIQLGDRPAARAATRHVCLHAQTLEKQALPEPLAVLLRLLSSSRC